MRVLQALLLIAMAGTILLSQEARQIPATTSDRNLAVEVLQRTIRTLSGSGAVQYTVERIPAHPESANILTASGHTRILAAIGQPSRYRARFEPVGPGATEFAVSDGHVTRVSDGGKLSEGPDRAMMDRASADAMPTLGAFDPESYKELLSGQVAVYAGQDDVEGELCQVVALTSIPKDGVGSKTTFYWLSSKTGLPRSQQIFRIIDGGTVLTDRWIFSDIRLMPAAPPGTFSYRPTAADSAPQARSEGPLERRPSVMDSPGETKSTTSLIGLRLPDFGVRRMDGRIVPLSSFLQGKTTIVTLWATWCAPCVDEMPVLQAEADRHPKDLLVIAIAVQDSRLHVLEFVHKHPQYRFVYATDPDIANPNSEINRFFVGESVPRNAIIDERRRVVDYRLTPYSESTLDSLEKQWER